LKELYIYGENDTKILLGAIIEFRKLLLTISRGKKKKCKKGLLKLGYDVLAESTTIASMAMKIFKSLYLEKVCNFTILTLYYDFARRNSLELFLNWVMIPPITQATKESRQWNGLLKNGVFM
jgi:hypothetical protein